VAERVAELEAKFNDGLPFQPVFRMPPGRRAGRPSRASADGPVDAVGPVGDMALDAPAD